MTGIQPVLDEKAPAFRWFVLAIALTLQLSSQAILFGPSPVAGTIIDSLGINAAQFGLLMSATSVAVMVCVPFGSVVVDRLGLRRGLVVGAAVMGLGGSVVAVAVTFNWLVFARLTQGLGFALMAPPLMASIMAWFTPREKPVVNTIFSACAFIGTAVAFAATPGIVNVLNGNWRMGLALYGVIMLAAAAVWGALGRETGAPTPSAANGTRGRSSLGVAVRMRTAWLLTLGVFAVAWVYQMYFYFLPLFFETERGLPAAEAARLASLLPLSGTLGVAIFGLVPGRILPEKHSLWITSAFVIVGSFGIFSADSRFASVGLFLAGVGTAGWLPVLFTYTMALPGMTPSLVAAFLVMINIAVYSAGFIAPALVGWLSETSLGLTGALALFTWIELGAIVSFLLLPTPGDVHGRFEQGHPTDHSDVRL